MVRDRLAELQKNCDVAYSPLNQRQDFIPAEIHPGSADQQITYILNTYSDIRDGINEIKSNVQSMRNLLAELSSSINNNKTLPEQMEALRGANMTLCQELFAKMRDLEKDLPFKDDHVTISRIKRTNFYCVRDDFLAAWHEHESFLISYEEKVKKSLMRQAKIIDQNMTEEETENLINNKTTSLFVGNIIEETENARSHLRDLLVRHTELTKIEKSLTEVRDMFIRISTLVMEQSTLVQVVEYHAQQASLNVDKGNDELEQARHYKIKSAKCLNIEIHCNSFYYPTQLLLPGHDGISGNEVTYELAKEGSNAPTFRREPSIKVSQCSVEKLCNKLVEKMLLKEKVLDHILGGNGGGDYGTTHDVPVSYLTQKSADVIKQQFFNPNSINHY